MCKYLQDLCYLKLVAQSRPNGYKCLTVEQVSDTNRIDVQLEELCRTENMAVRQAGNSVCLSTDGGSLLDSSVRMIMADFGPGPDIQHVLSKPQQL